MDTEVVVVMEAMEVMQQELSMSDKEMSYMCMSEDREIREELPADGMEEELCLVMLEEEVEQTFG